MRKTVQMCREAWTKTYITHHIKTHAAIDTAHQTQSIISTQPNISLTPQSALHFLRYLKCKPAYLRLLHLLHAVQIRMQVTLQRFWGVGWSPTICWKSLFSFSQTSPARFICACISTTSNIKMSISIESSSL